MDITEQVPYMSFCMIFALIFLTPTPSYMVFALTNFVIFTPRVLRS